ncbi:MAG: hypothetical protein Q8Q31_01485 [Nanoarchaeota archaeon]|nr:hypothetical protein [Nanoarchaeota archaeon]
MLYYIYLSIARRGKSKYAPGIAWIPLVGPALIASDIAGMHWWPVLLLIGLVVPVVGPILLLVFVIFFVIWMWKTFEALDKPGWWAIFAIIPLLNIVYLIFVGIAAWGKK